MSLSKLDSSKYGNCPTKVRKLLDVLEDVKRHILKWGCDKPPGMTYKDYICNELKFSNTRLKVLFKKHQIEKLREDPTGDSFDITLLYICIQTCCKKLARYNDEDSWTTKRKTLEYGLYEFKLLRNKVSHGTLSSEELNDLIEEYKGKIDFVCRETGSKYSVDDTAVKMLISNSFKRLDSINTITSMKIEGKKELQSRLEWMSSVDFILSNDCERTDILDTFVEMDLKIANRNPHQSAKFSVTDLLEVKNESGDSPAVIIVSGVAGAGKTTIAKVVMAWWLKESGVMSTLKDYHLILYVECRNTGVTDIPELLKHLMPDTTRDMTDEDITHVLQSLRVLVIVDGYDELPDRSQPLFTELLQKLCSSNVNILITTAPDKEESLMDRIPVTSTKVLLKIEGIPPERIYEFVSRCENVICRNKQKNRDQCSELIDALKTTPGLSQILTLPLNLQLLTTLWIKSPRRLNWLRTSTSLYYEIVKLIKERLVDRIHLLQHQTMTREKLEEHINEFFQLICRVSSVTLREGNLTLSPESVDELETKCTHLNLPANVVFPAFFCSTMNEIRDTKDKRISYFHKRFLDYYSALYVCDCLKRDSQNTVISKINRDLQDSLVKNKIPIGVTKRIEDELERVMQKNLPESVTVIDILRNLHGDDQEPFQLSKYRNMLVHVIGSLKKERHYKPFYVELVRLLKEAGLTESEEWLNILTETNSDPDILAEVREVIEKDILHIRDSNLKAAHSLVNADFRTVHVDTSGDDCKLQDLRTLFDILSTSHSLIRLVLKQHFQNPDLHHSDHILQFINVRCVDDGMELIQFTGSVKDLKSLDKQLELMFLALGSTYANEGDHAVDYIADNFQYLENLHLHIKGGMALEILPKIPSNCNLSDLWFSDIDDSLVDWVGEAVNHLASGKIKYSCVAQPFWSIRFPRSNLTVKGCKHLGDVLKEFLREKKGNLVVGGGVIVSSERITRADLEGIRTKFDVQTGSFNLTDEIRIWNIEG